MSTTLATPALLEFAERALRLAWSGVASAEAVDFGRDALLRAFVSAERSVVLRVLAALAREGRIPLEDRRTAWSVRLSRGGGASEVELPIAQRAAHGLHRWREEDVSGLPTLRALLEDLSGPIAELQDAANFTRVARELTSSVIQLALARVAAPARDALRQAAPGDPRARDPEHWVVDGHPWHPMSRMRVGLSLASALRHAPEQLARTTVVALALPADHVVRSPAWDDAIARLLDTPGGARSADSSVLLPIHVAQLKRLRSDPRRAHLLESATVVDVPNGARERLPGMGEALVLPARSLASLRTVDTERGVHLKLSLDVHTTSTRRIVSPMSVANGPEITRLLTKISDEDPECRGYELMREDATAGLCPSRYGAFAGEIGAILRPVPSPRPAWICAALGDRRPGSVETPPGDTLLAEWSKHYPGHTRGDRVRALLDAYVDAFFPWSLRLLVAHGIALELHLQNVLAVLDESGRLACFRVRDLGGIRVHGPRLAAAGHGVTFAPGSFTVTDDLAEVRDKWMHTSIHAHFGTVLTWGDALGARPEEGWARIHQRIRTCLLRWRNAPGASDAVRSAATEDEAALFAPRARAKALFTMRLRQRSSDYDYVDVENVLHAVTPARSHSTETR